MAFKKYPERLRDSHSSILFEHLKANGGKTVYELMQAFNMKKTSVIDVLRPFLLSGQVIRRPRYEAEQDKGRPRTEFICKEMGG